MKKVNNEIRKEIMKMAHDFAKDLEGDYSARLSYALKETWKSVNINKVAFQQAVLDTAEKTIYKSNVNNSSARDYLRTMNAASNNSYKLSDAGIMYIQALHFTGFQQKVQTTILTKGWMSEKQMSILFEQL